MLGDSVDVIRWPKHPLFSGAVCCERILILKCKDLRNMGDAGALQIEGLCGSQGLGLVDPLCLFDAWHAVACMP